MVVTGGLDAAQVAVLDLHTGTRTILVRGGTHAHYVPSGHLVYVTAGPTGPRVLPGPSRDARYVAPVVPDVVTTGNGDVGVVMAGDATLAYVSGGDGGVSGAGALRTLAWVDRQGHETPKHGATARVRLSPAVTRCTRIALFANDQERDIWVWDQGRTTLTRVTLILVRIPSRCGCRMAGD